MQGTSLTNWAWTSPPIWRRTSSPPPFRVSSQRVCDVICLALKHTSTVELHWLHLWTERWRAWWLPQRIRDSVVRAGSSWRRTLSKVRGPLTQPTPGDDVNCDIGGGQRLCAWGVLLTWFLSQFAHYRLKRPLACCDLTRQARLLSTRPRRLSCCDVTATLLRSGREAPGQRHRAHRTWMCGPSIADAVGHDRPRWRAP